MIARVVGLIVSWVGEGTVYILRGVDCPHRRTRPEGEGKVKVRSGFVGRNVRCPRLRGVEVMGGCRLSVRVLE